MMGLDLSSDPGSARTPRIEEGHLDGVPGTIGKKFIGIRFNCCGVYSRIYVNREGTAYEGRCPKCMNHVCLKIGVGGTDQRFFETY